MSKSQAANQSQLEPGATRLAFASVAQATEHLKQAVVTAAPDKAPLKWRSP